MTHDDYWRDLVDRVYDHEEVLQGDEERFYRLTCIYGETMVDGIEAYFVRRANEYDDDQKTLRSEGFADVADQFAEARGLIFGDEPLTPESADRRELELLQLDDDSELLRAIEELYRQMIPRLEQLAEHKYALGLRAGLFDPDPE